MKNDLTSISFLTAGLACLGLATGFVAGQATAQSPTNEEPFKFHFQYDPSELATQTGAENLLVRLESKVHSACDTPARNTIEDRRVVRVCINNTTKATIDSFGSATVAKVFQSRTAG